MRFQLLILATTIILTVVMIFIIAVRKPFIANTPSPGGEAIAEAVEEGWRREAAGRVSRGPVEPEDIARTTLRSLLRRLASTRAPGERRELIDKARARAEEFEPHLIEVLTDANDEFILEAVALTPLSQSAIVGGRFYAVGDTVFDSTSGERIEGCTIAAIEAKRVLLKDTVSGTSAWLSVHVRGRSLSWKLTAE